VCGLIGIFSSNMLMKHKEVLSTLLYLDTFRGKDSTGVAAIRHNADTAILKSTVPGYEFIEGNRLDHHLRLNDFCWIGHNRFGTIGKNIKSNAHPFEILDEDGSVLLVGAHNGTLKNKHILADHATFGTDSEALFNSIALEGLEKTIATVDGAWALTYYDHITEELRFLRNKERPLFFAFEEGCKTLVWASEIWMIRIAMSRFGLKLERDEVHEVSEDTLYKFSAPMKPNDVITFETKGGVVGKQTPDFFPGVHGTERWGSGIHGGGHHLPQTTSQTTPPRKVPALAPHHNSNLPSTTQTGSSGGKPPLANDTSSNKQTDNVRPILSAKSYKGYNGKMLARDELLDQLANGCSWCETEFIRAESRYAWLADGHPVCMKCLTDSHVMTEEDRKLVIMH